MMTHFKRAARAPLFVVLALVVVLYSFGQTTAPTQARASQLAPLSEQYASDHLYNFSNPNAQTQIPHWDVDPQWGAAAWDNVYIENEALVANAVFNTNSDPARKGFINIIYSPPLNLAHKDQRVIQLDIGFNPPAVAPINSYPFDISFWIWDDAKQRWFPSNYKNVGQSAWTTVSFDLDNPAEYAPGIQDYPADLPTLTDIRRVAVQVWANVPYTGKVMFDNIRVGGKEIPGQYPNNNNGFITVQGTEFIQGGKPYRFVGVNAEYLFTVSEAVMQSTLDSAQRFGPTVVRTWGMGEGCENGSPDCAPGDIAYSRRFQPERGIWNESALENFDRLVAIAGKLGLRLIIPLVNNWDEYGGIPQYMAWLEKEYPLEIVIPPGIQKGTKEYDAYLHDLFFTNAHTRQWYKAYVTALISRTNTITGIPYTSDPTIFAWEVINEPRAKSDVSGKAIHNWLAEMSDYIYSLDPNHLIGSGEEGWYIQPAADTLPLNAWQTFPKNYWHYGVNWWSDCATGENYGSNGSDFISDHSSFPTIVNWQAYVGTNCTSPVQSDLRSGLPHIAYTSLHLYIAESESNLYRAPYCAWSFEGNLCDQYNQVTFQAGEWIKQHLSDSHDRIGKPFLVTEFGLRNSETYNGSPGSAPQFVPALTPEERQQLMHLYLQYMQNLGVNGVLVWNLGYDRVNDMLWDGIETTQNWGIDPNSDATALSLNKGPAAISWGSRSIRVDYNPARKLAGVKIDRGNFSENWLTAGRTKLELDLYNAGNAAYAKVAILSGDPAVVYESRAFTLEQGIEKENTIIANTLLPYWTCTSPGCKPTKVVNDLDQVHGVSLILYGYTQPGSLYIDYFRHQGSDSLVMYPNDPIYNTVLVESWRWFGALKQTFLPAVFK